MEAIGKEIVLWCALGIVCVGGRYCMNHKCVCSGGFPSIEGQEKRWDAGFL